MGNDPPRKSMSNAKNLSYMKSIARLYKIVITGLSKISSKTRDNNHLMPTGRKLKNKAKKPIWETLIDHSDLLLDARK